MQDDVDALNGQGDENMLPAQEHSTDMQEFEEQSDFLEGASHPDLIKCGKDAAKQRPHGVRSHFNLHIFQVYKGNTYTG